jgi:predicted MFS family arabinose efflux permease
MFSIGYLNFTVLLMLLAGGWLIRFDVKSYERSGLEKESKASRFLGWFYLVVGVCLFAGNWIIQRVNL